MIAATRRRILVPLLLVGAVGCARSIPPPGGPIDTTPPRVLATSPADSSVRVSPTDGVDLLFSEGMDRASVRDNLRVYPPAAFPSYSWKGRQFRVAWGETLRANTTYQIFLSGKARDLRGVPMGTPLQVRFSTGDSLSPGRITGVLRAKTLSRQGVPILLFPAAVGLRPDTTRAFEPSYQTETDTIGVYAFAGLPTDEAFTVHAFYDRNGDSYFDPDQDVLVDYAAPVRLTPGRTLADSINFVAVDPRAPGILLGSIDSPDSLARFQVEVRAAADSSLVTRMERTGPGTYSIRVPAGRYWLAGRRLATPGRPARPGVGTRPGVAPVPAFTEAVARIESPVNVHPEEEQGPFVLTFPADAAATPTAPAPEEEPR